VAGDLDPDGDLGSAETGEGEREERKMEFD